MKVMELYSQNVATRHTKETRQKKSNPRREMYEIVQEHTHTHTYETYASHTRIARTMRKANADDNRFDSFNINKIKATQRKRFTCTRLGPVCGRHPISLQNSSLIHGTHTYVPRHSPSFKATGMINEDSILW